MPITPRNYRSPADDALAKLIGQGIEGAQQMAANVGKNVGTAVGRERDAQIAQDKQTNEIAQAEALAKKYPKHSVRVGGASINPENEGLMALLNLRERQDARDDRDLVQLGNRVEKEGIPGTMAAIVTAEQRTADLANKKGGIVTNPDYQVKSAGPAANWIRNAPLGQFALNMGEKFGLMPQGSSEEMSMIQRLMNQDIRNMSGTAVTAYEQGRQNVEKGLMPGGDPNAVKLGIKQMVDAVNNSAKNIQSSTRPKVMGTFKAQGGKVTLEDFLGGKAAAPAPATGGLSPEEQAELDQLRKELGK